MTMKAVNGKEIDGMLLRKYFNNLINMYFKILPLYEGREGSLKSYMENLRDELLGCGDVIKFIHEDPQYMSLIATLQYLIAGLDSDELDKSKVKNKVFGAISVCGKLSERYSGKNEESPEGSAGDTA